MGLFDFLSSREKKVSNQKLEANISKLCEELTTGIIQLSEKAKQLNELKDKYNQMQSEVQTTGAPGETSPTKPEKEKSLFSTLFGSSQDDTPPASPTTQPIPDNNLQTSEDNINPDMLSAASTASPEQAQSSSIDQPLKDFSQADTPQGSLPLPDYNSISSSSVGSDAMQPAAVPGATQQLPPPPPQLDYNNISSNPFGSDAMQPVPAPAATPDAAAAAAPSPSLEEALQKTTMPLAQPLPPPPPPPPTLQPPVAQNPIESSAISTGGKNRKKSKRSKKTIRRSDKTLNKVTKKQKINNADSSDSGDSKAKAQGLAQALLEAQGQS
jgi:hypothetical protein